MVYLMDDKERPRTVSQGELLFEEALFFIWRGRLVGQGGIVSVTFNSVEGYGGVHSVSVKWRSCSFSVSSGDVYVVYHSNVLRY